MTSIIIQNCSSVNLLPHAEKTLQTVLTSQPSVGIRPQGNHQPGSKQIPGDVVLGVGSASSFHVSQPVLHVHPNGVQVEAAPAVEADHLPLRRSRGEVGPDLVAERAVLASAADEGERSQDPGPFFHAGVVVPVDAGQDLVWIVKLDLQQCAMCV